MKEYKEVEIRLGSWTFKNEEKQFEKEIFELLPNYLLISNSGFFEQKNYLVATKRKLKYNFFFT